ncbi:MAG: helix-turn-helix transcriptional regulator [Muribaculaceae bacterium]|nr:helix-turn-helix transcriptional regulator [Muribaculaceae bacterium]
MKKLSEYRAADKMSDLINDNSSLLMVMSRFGISLGFGDKTVGEICKDQGVDAGTFLAVANYISEKKHGYEAETISLPSLTDYLKRAHVYFLDFSLPAIRRKLIEAIDCSGTDDVAFLVLRFFDEYVMEVRRHMEYENDTVFEYVGSLLRGECDGGYKISMFADKHNHIELKLKELKDIIIRYYPEKENDLLNAVLFDIINCEQDLGYHCQVEDNLFVPVVERLEKSLKKRGKAASVAAQVENEEGGEKLEALSQREKEIIGCVAKGMANKEIADSLCISIHTVTTHRRNIATKLQIHTPAGLTIYAIVNKLVKLQDIKMT